MKFVFQKVLLFSIITSFLACNSKVQKTVSKESKPNVLFILVDDLGYADLSVMGSKYYE